MKVTLNKSEAVTVLRRSKGGGQIWVRAYGERSPYAVAFAAVGRFDADHLATLREHINSFGRDPRRYRGEYSWSGS